MPDTAASALQRRNSPFDLTGFLERLGRARGRAIESEQQARQARLVAAAPGAS